MRERQLLDPIFLLTTLDQNYLPQLQVLLTSLAVNHPRDTFVLLLLHSGIPEDALDKVQQRCKTFGYSFLPITVTDNLFQGAPVSRQYPKEMYYRLLASHLLPKQIKRVLYRLSMKKLYGLNSDEDDIEEDDDPCDVE